MSDVNLIIKGSEKGRPVVCRTTDSGMLWHIYRKPWPRYWWYSLLLLWHSTQPLRTDALHRVCRFGDLIGARVWVEISPSDEVGNARLTMEYAWWYRWIVWIAFWLAEG